MKSRTSFSKLTVFKKNITRFAPIWALYFIGLMLVLVENGYYGRSDRFANYMMNDLVSSFGIVNLIYAGVIAVMLFGDLYNTRMCYSLHTIPMRREGILLSNLASGLLFSLVPNTLAALYLMLHLQEFSLLAVFWLLAVTAQFLFFFGLATVSALLTGNRFAMLAVYAGFNFVAILLYGVVQTIYLPMLPGVVANMADYSRFSPVVHLVDNFEFFRFESYEVFYEEGIKEYSETYYRYLGLGNGWGYTAILGALGLVAMGISVWLYRLRHLECAGDFVAFAKTKGAACVIITLCVMLCMALVGEIFGVYIIWLVVGLVVGFFGSLMLLERRVKVFNKRNLIGFAAMAVTVAISFAAMAGDWFGIVKWIPDGEKVASVTLANYRADGFNYATPEDFHYGNRIAVTLTKPEEIAEAIEAHEDILPRLNEVDAQGNSVPTHYVVIAYKMTSGRTVTRAYNAPANGKNYEIISKYFYQPEQILGYTDPAKAAKELQYAYGPGGQIIEAYGEALFTALQKDCQNGFVVPMNDKFDGVGYVEYYFQVENGGISRNLYLLEGAENTLALLNSPQVLLGYEDWDKFLYNVEMVEVEYQSLESEHYEGLLTAIRTDIENGNITCAYNEKWEERVTGIAISSGRYYTDLLITKEAVNTLKYLADNGIFVP